MKKIFILILFAGSLNFYGQKENKDSLNDIIARSTKILQAMPHHAIAYKNRAKAKLLLNDNKGAIDDYTAAILLDPRYDSAYVGRGAARLNLNDINDAMEDFNKALALNPISDLAYYNRGCANEKMEYYEEAIEDYTMALQLNRKIKSAYINRGRIKHNIFKDDMGAIEDYDKVIEKYPQYADAYYYRGNANRNLGDMAGACNDWNTAVELGNINAKLNLFKYCR
jgi:tetratricopeptide (TPR) repeat protein